MPTITLIQPIILLFFLYVKAVGWTGLVVERKTRKAFLLEITDTM